MVGPEKHFPPHKLAGGQTHDLLGPGTYGAMQSIWLGSFQMLVWTRLTPSAASVGSLAIGEVVLGETDEKVKLQTYIGTDNEVEELVTR